MALSPPDLTCPVISYPDKRNSSKQKNTIFTPLFQKYSVKRGHRRQEDHPLRK
jgi:hypothetical protein